MPGAIHEITNSQQLRDLVLDERDTIRIVTAELDLGSVSNVVLATDNLVVEGGLDTPSVIRVGDSWQQVDRQQVFLVDSLLPQISVVFRNLDFQGGHTTGSRPDWGRERKAVVVLRGQATFKDCCFVGWPHAAIDLNGSSDGPAEGTVESCCFSACRADGLGYGVVVGNAKAMVRHCAFSGCRHAIASRHGQPSEYTAMNNVVIVTENESSFDVHGTIERSDVTFEYRLNAEAPNIVEQRNMQWCGGAGGTRYEIAYNSFILMRPDTDTSHWKVVHIRGVPADICRIYNNHIFSLSGKKGSIGILGGTYDKFRMFSNRRVAMQV